MSPSRPSFSPQLHVYPKAPVSSSPATHYSLPTNHFSSPFVFITLRIAFPATPLFSQPSELPGGVGISAVHLATRLPRALSAKGHFPLRSISPFVYHDPRGVTRHSITQSVVCEGPLPPRPISPLVTRHSPLPLDCEPQLLTTFKINTCKCVTKQMTLSVFRINTYAKSGEGVSSVTAYFKAQPRTVLMRASAASHAARPFCPMLLLVICSEPAQP